ncbi:MAG TPA: LPS assembly lipoprotein LptE [Bryobacteraceae bacterium]|nr:LPS assembly lipoprotein LptE [Bryobacteraceae bacterium]
MTSRSVCPGIFAALALAAGCGYHVAGHANLVPKEIKTIAIPAFGNGTVRYKLPRLIAAGIAQEFISRTHYSIVADPEQADATLTGTLLTFTTNPTIFDPVSGRATGVQVVATLKVTLTDRHTGKILFTRPSLEFRERYEITLDPQAYFDESDTAAERLSRDVARTVVSAILDNF